MIQNLQINALSTKPVLFEVSKTQKSNTLKYKKNLNRDVVSFTSLQLLRKTPILKRMIGIVTGRPTAPQLAKEALVITSQLAGVISAGIALSVYPAKFVKQLKGVKLPVSSIK